MKIFKRAGQAVFWLSLLDSSLYGQGNSNQKALTYDAALAASPDEHHVFRAEGFYIRGKTNVFGFIDGYGPKTENYYTEIYGRRDFAERTGIQLELNDGKDIPGAFRVGAIFDIPNLPKRVYANVKILPVNVTGSEVTHEVQIGHFTSIELGKGWHFEHWVDFNLGKTEAPKVISEATATKKIKGRWYAVFRASYKVNTEGFGFRAGFRYKMF